MKIYRVFSIAGLVFLLAAASFAQSSQTDKDSPNAAEDAATLRLKLFEIEGKQGELQNRLLQLDEDLKPQNIERATAGYGSTRPEELREQRRRQLEIERNGVVEQLGTLAASRANLETAIANADALAYQQSARGFPVDMVGGLASRNAVRVVLIAGLIGMIGIAALVVFARRMRRKSI